ncbi:hypothetical protein MUK72_11525 [Halococcus dombrowskii]|jgi:hypothetical protein|uniref:Uncharacterized protein n=1 Tax=Halococcus dombrowskii TaxID=179637 RepID=A0AAV3SES4_HALDO|nr:hypothetical protein [Halococcus dombrowskii]UOO94593.1 hypothetical protein MUK72_11525 [Halococcus dombrowskii]
MDYTRIYWLCLLGFGLLLSANFVPDLLAGTAATSNVVGLVGAVTVVAVALYGVGRPAAAGGPTRPNLPFWGAVLGFVLTFAGTVLPFL